MIIIQPKKKSSFGLKLLEIIQEQETINQETEVVAIRIDANNILFLAISKHGAIKVWVQGNKEFVKGKEQGIDLQLEDRYLNNK